jgi:hypothetical protein
MMAAPRRKPVLPRVGADAESLIIPRDGSRDFFHRRLEVLMNEAFR